MLGEEGFVIRSVAENIDPRSDRSKVSYPNPSCYILPHNIIIFTIE